MLKVQHLLHRQNDQVSYSTPGIHDSVSYYADRCLLVQMHRSQQISFDLVALIYCAIFVLYCAGYCAGLCAVFCAVQFCCYKCSIVLDCDVNSEMRHVGLLTFFHQFQINDQATAWRTNRNGRASFNIASLLVRIWTIMLLLVQIVSL